MEFLTDGFPSENSWVLVNTCTGQVEQSVESDQRYVAENTLYFDEYCVPDAEYEFTIFDSFGDGICCEFGDGSYAVTYDGVEVASGGEFGSSETSDPFGNPDAPDACVVSPSVYSRVSAGKDWIDRAVECRSKSGKPNGSSKSGKSGGRGSKSLKAGSKSQKADKSSSKSSKAGLMTPAPTKTPTKMPSPPEEVSYYECFPLAALISPLSLCSRSVPLIYLVLHQDSPTESPSYLPTYYPTISPVEPGECPSNTNPLTVEVLTDLFPEETSWVLVNSCTGELEAEIIVFEDPDTLYTDDYCLPDGAEYMYTISDSFGDGICCGENGNGTYTVTYDGDEVASGGEFGFDETTTFGVSESPADPIDPPPGFVAAPSCDIDSTCGYSCLQNDDFGDVTPGYKIDLSLELLNPDGVDAFLDAREKWSSIITSNLEPYPSAQVDNLDGCRGDHLPEIIDDL